MVVINWKRVGRYEMPCTWLMGACWRGNTTRQKEQRRMDVDESVHH